MGNQQNIPTRNPAEMKFKRRHPISLHPSLIQMLERLALIIQYPNIHTNQTLRWYEAIGLDFYLYGDVKNNMPTGQCLFYSKKEIYSDSPIVIATNINQDGAYSKKTLLIYSDYSYYFGSIKQTEQGPVGEGIGTLVSKDLLYDGQFENGFPHGYGFMKTRNADLTGLFRYGEPQGDCIQKTKKGLFIGQLFPKIRKYGKMVTPENKVEMINQEYPQNGKTVVEL